MLVNRFDSFAIWNVPENEISDDREREVEFGKVYQPFIFPETKTDLLIKSIKEMKYVLIGLNPGDAGPGPGKCSFLNFHGNKKSMDYRLAAAIYGTEMWGAFMTDLVHVNRSDSNYVDISKDDIIALRKHLADLEVRDNVVLIALGNNAYKALKDYYQELPLQVHIEKLPHYSGSNGHWKTADTRIEVLSIINKYKDII